MKQEDKIDATVGGGPFYVNVLPDGPSRYSWIRNPESID